MKTSKLIVLATAVYASGCGPAAKAPEPAAMSPPQTILVQAADWPSRFEAGGVVRSRAVAPIASRIAATVAEIHVRAGDRVRRGAPLITLDAREATANRARAVAAVNGAVESIRAAEGAVRAAEADAKIARATHDRIRTLHNKRSATAQELDQAAAVVDATDAQVSSARANLAAATAGREAAQAASAAAVIASSYAVLSAPFDGAVSERHVDPGAMASPGVPLLTLEDPSALQLEVTVDAARAAYVATGQAADVRIGSDQTDDAWTAAQVVEVARIDPLAHSFLVKLSLAPAAGLRSGAYGRARFSGPARRALVVPATAVVHRGQLAFVFVVDEGQRPRLQPVSIGETDDGRLEILAGVREGEAVVSTPAPFLIEGDRATGSGQ